MMQANATAWHLLGLRTLQWVHVTQEDPGHETQGVIPMTRSDEDSIHDGGYCVRCNSGSIYERCPSWWICHSVAPPVGRTPLPLVHFLVDGSITLIQRQLLYFERV